MPIIFGPRIGASLIGHLIGGMTGAAITRQSSFLLDSLGKRIFPEGLTIIDDTVRPRGLRSHPFDGEGLPSRCSPLLDKGVLTGRLLSIDSERQQGRTTPRHHPRGPA